MEYARYTWKVHSIEIRTCEKVLAKSKPQVTSHSILEPHVFQQVYHHINLDSLPCLFPLTPASELPIDLNISVYLPPQLFLYDAARQSANIFDALHNLLLLACSYLCSSKLFFFSLPLRCTQHLVGKVTGARDAYMMLQGGSTLPPCSTPPQTLSQSR